MYGAASYELATPGPSPIASEALEHIAALYAIEKDIRGRGADERRAVRQQRSRPLIDALEPWLRAKIALISQKSKLAVTIRYALSRWEGLTRFIDDGRIELDNNTVERSIRPIALNRKNALFAGSDGGAEHWATIASLIAVLCSGKPTASRARSTPIDTRRSFVQSSGPTAVEKEGPLSVGAFDARRSTIVNGRCGSPL